MLAVLMVSSTDKTGIVAALSNLIFQQGGNVIDADQHSDKDSGMFFMRLAWTLENFRLTRSQLEIALNELATNFEKMRWQLWYHENTPRIAIFCSKAPHCLYDLLLRETTNELGGQIALVISNHAELKTAAEHFAKPFFHLPTNTQNKNAVENQQLQILREQKIDVIVLARYMQILSPQFISAYQQNIINIHHSFLPAFIGADPYRQAKERGVKIIGATAHYVNEMLDGGAIIEQDVTRVTHRDTVQDLIRKGRDLERQVLSRAVRAHLQRRVLVYANKTVVFAE